MSRLDTGVGVLDKAVQLLDIVGDADFITVNELIRRSGLPKTTVHRLVQALEAHGFLRRNESGQLIPGVRVTAFNLRLLATPVLRKLTAETGESAQLYVRRGGSRVVIVSVESVKELRATVPVGALLPLDRGAPGRVLAGDAETLKQGWTERRRTRARRCLRCRASVRRGCRARRGRHQRTQHPAGCARPRELCPCRVRSGPRLGAVHAW